MAGDGLPPLRAVIAVHQLSAKKALGQNFILDLNVTRRIARAAAPFGHAVYEVGPGPGGLTRGLLSEGAPRVIAVERDARCIAALAEVASAHPGRLTVIGDDALKVDERALLAAEGAALPVSVAANLPFNVRTAQLVKWLTVSDWPPWWSRLTLMFQREVADRIVAKPGAEAYGRLAVLTQWRSDAKILFDVPRSVFVPPPNVDSAVIQIEPLPAPRFAAELSDLEAVTAAAFGQRRKMLRGSLKALGVDTAALLSEAGIEPTLRPEEIALEGFCALARSLRAARGQRN
jgi:16S rRNA (adenine1518-N6/adenine1519-N6)-dimethyltransferase